MQQIRLIVRIGKVFIPKMGHLAVAGKTLGKVKTLLRFWMMGDSGLMSAKLEAGDAIVVPEKLMFSTVMKAVKDITKIMMQLAVTLWIFLAIP